MSVRKLETVNTRRAWSAVVIGSPFLELIAAGHRVQVGLDVPLSVELGERGEVGVELGEEAAEVDEAGGHAGHGLCVGTCRSCAPDRRRMPAGAREVHVDDAIGERLGLLPVRRRSVEDAQVEQHPVGAVEGRPVVAPPLAGLASARRRQARAKLIEVVEGQLLEAARWSR